MKSKRSEFLTKEPLSQQVYDYVHLRIERGDYAPNDRLPSVRSLAEQFGVHRLTVFKSYQQLVKDHFIYAKDRSGYYVCPHPAVKLTSQPDKTFTNAIDSGDVIHLHQKKNQEQILTAQPLHSAASQLTKEDSLPFLSLTRRTHVLSALHQQDVQYQFSKALIDPSLLPNTYMSEYVKQVFDMYPKLLGTYSTVQGDFQLRKVMAEYFNARHHMSLSPEDILVTSGATQAIDLAARMLIKPGDVVLVERPTYSTAIDIFRQAGARIVTVEMRPDGYDMEQLEHTIVESRPRLMYVNPTYHNPTGYVLPEEKRKLLIELAEQYQFIIAEDDTTYDMYFADEPPPPIYSYDTEGVVMYIRSFSKYVAPGLRIAFVLCKPWLMKEALTLKSLTDGGSPLLGQKIFEHYFTSSRMQTHMEKLRIALSLRKEKMEQMLTAADWQWISPEGGLDLWVQLPAHVDAIALLEKSLERSVAFVPGPFCDPLPQGSEAYIRLSYCYTSEKQIEEGMERLLIAYANLH
ncbi:aminotransferase-like domain-containing protein [Paenibacillus urinalis]|uniref:aminotransferase-like domain-containing protein n=1 Tax=Paenibacillus urinalis TaxID=521520 RepID=UPI00195F68E1